MVLIQHLYGLSSLRRTAEEVRENNCYRWFLGYRLQEKTPHFSAVSYNFKHRFTPETVSRIFDWILNAIAEAGYLYTYTVFVDGIHIKANVNNKKVVKTVSRQIWKPYVEPADELRYYGRHFTRREELLDMIHDYIAYCNNRRVQRNLGILTPAKKHEQFYLAA